LFKAEAVKQHNIAVTVSIKIVTTTQAFSRFENRLSQHFIEFGDWSKFERYLQ